METSKVQVGFVSIVSIESLNVGQSGQPEPRGISAYLPPTQAISSLIEKPMLTN